MLEPVRAEVFDSIKRFAKRAVVQSVLFKERYYQWIGVKLYGI